MLQKIVTVHSKTFNDKDIRSWAHFMLIILGHHVQNGSYETLLGQTFYVGTAIKGVL